MQLSLAQTNPNCARPAITVLPENCCKIPEFFDDEDLINCKNSRGVDLIPKSRKKRFATSRMELGTCYLDCVFIASGVTSANGQVLDTNKLLRVLVKETPNEAESITVITNAVTQCIYDLNSGNLRVRNPTQYNCSTIPSAIMMCIHKKFFLSCPSNRFTNTNDCQLLKDFLQRCPIPL